MRNEVASPVAIAYPPGGEMELSIRVGAGRLELSGAEQPEWVRGGYTGPAGSAPRVQGGTQAAVEVGRDIADLLGATDRLPDLRLSLGTARPFGLRVSAGAGSSDLSLGGVPLTRLDVSCGAGPVRVAFSRPNPAVLRTARISVGAGRLEVHGLGNAGFEELVVEGGAAECILDFTGVPVRPARVRLSAAIGRIEVQIPESLSAEITASALLGGAVADAAFVNRPPRILTQAAAAGAPPVFQIQGSTALGKLDFVTIRDAA